MRVLSVFGTRPEAIKMAPVVRALSQHKDISSRVCVTGQHREMLDQVMATFALKADYDLDIMQPGQALGDVLARVSRGLGPVFNEFQPDYVLVQGDTVSSTAAAVAASTAASPSAMSRLACAPATSGALGRKKPTDGSQPS